nr:S16 family serine protease [Nanchangia anserum]
MRGKARTDGPGVLIGVAVDPQVKLPVDIDITLDNVGGPSAGMMFALGIIEVMTDEEHTDNGPVIAGTGAVSMGGGVLQISGVPQKMRAATDAGAHWFLLPETNCADALGHVPDGLRIVPVESLHEARDVVDDIERGQTADLPQCSS